MARKGLKNLKLFLKGQASRRYPTAEIMQLACLENDDNWLQVGSAVTFSHLGILKDSKTTDIGSYFRNNKHDNDGKESI